MLSQALPTAAGTRQKATAPARVLRRAIESATVDTSVPEVLPKPALSSLSPNLGSRGHDFSQVPLSSPSPPSGSRLMIQRKCACGKPTAEGECTECKKNKESRAGDLIMPKLLVGPVDDPLEREADRVADQIVNHAPPTNPHLPPPSSPSSRGIGTSLAASAAPTSVPTIQRLTPGPGAGGAVIGDAADVISQAGPGRPLPADVRSDFESRFGHDFSHVRVHTDAAASQSAQSFQARAYTLGSHVVFGAGQFEPASSAGRHLLAHELTHVVQQGPSNFESETTDVATEPVRDNGTAGVQGESFSSRQNVSVSNNAHARSGTVMREPESKSESKGGFETVIGGLIGDFNEDPSLAEIGINTGVGLIPAVGEVTATRDVTANLYFMERKNEYTSPMRWLGLVFALISLFPEIGAALKGLGKAVLRGVGEAIGPIIRLVETVLAKFGHSEGVLNFFRSNWGKAVAGGMSLFEKVMTKLSSLLTRAVTFVSSKAEAFARGLARIKDAAMKFLPEAFEKAKGLFEDVLEKLGGKLEQKGAQQLEKEATKGVMPHSAPHPATPIADPSALSKAAEPPPVRPTGGVRKAETIEEFRARGGEVKKLPPGPGPEPSATARPKSGERLPEGTHEIRDQPNMDLRGVRASRPSHVLADALESRGMPRPPGHEAHHIVPEGMASAERARDILRKAGIDVNSAANGVWLRGRQLGVQTESFGSHLGIHTPQYVERLTRILEQAEREGRIVQALTDIGDFLRNGGQLH